MSYMSYTKTIPIQFGMVTLVGYIVTDPTKPIKGGNCFSLIDTDGSSHSVVNFTYENLENWCRLANQWDITVQCIPKSDHIWEIVDDRIPVEWYRQDGYCTVCTPIRMLPVEQRKSYLKNKTFHKTSTTGLIVSTPITSTGRKLDTTKWTFVGDTSKNDVH